MTTVEAKTNLRAGQFQLDVDFQIPSGKTTAVFGRSGSGKTTLLRWIAGLIPTEEGFLSIGDQVWQNSEKKIFKPAHERSVGYIFQENNLFPHVNIKKNLDYAIQRTPNLKRQEVSRAIEILGIEKFMNKYPHQISGGERQRVALARCLCMRPQILLWDEPFSALDIISKYEIYPFLDIIKKEITIPILYVSHSIDELNRFCDYMIYLDNGKIVNFDNLDFSNLF